MTAIRGYAKYATEKEVEKLISTFMEILMKRPEGMGETCISSFRLDTEPVLWPTIKIQKNGPELYVSARFLLIISKYNINHESISC